jgi:hypothetical protein
VTCRIRRINLGLVFQQILRGGEIHRFSTAVDWTEAGVVCCINVGPALAQEAYDFCDEGHLVFVSVDLAIAESEVQYAAAFGVLYSDVDEPRSLKEVFDGFELALLKGLEEWSGLTLASGLLLLQ